MRLALDATYAYSRELTGVGVYSRRLIDGLARQHPDSTLYECLRWKSFWRRNGSSPLPNVSRRLLLPPWPIVGADLFHALNQRVDRRPSRRVVVTFHDLFVMTAQYSTREFRERFIKQAKRAAQLADLVIAVSHFTASQVESLLGVPLSRIRVVPHGTDRPADLPSMREHMVLSVGAIQKRKNTLRLIQAFETLPASWRLVLAGPSTGYGAGEVLNYLQKSAVSERVQVLGYVSSAELENLYQRAGIFAFPSLDEGFGIPVLEAMAHGVPVVTSKTSALPEVAGDAALLVDPTDATSLAAALNQLAANPQLACWLSTLGRERALKFTWEAAVEKTEAVYRELLA